MRSVSQVIIWPGLTPGKIIKFSPEEGPSGGEVVVADQQGDRTDCDEEVRHCKFSSIVVVVVVIVVDKILHCRSGRGHGECTWKERER